MGNCLIVSKNEKFYGIDTSNVIEEKGTSTQARTYTATQDCWIIMRNYSWGSSASTSKANINGIPIDAATGNNGPANFNMCLPLKKGQSVLLWNDNGYNSNWYKVFGLKG